MASKIINLISKSIKEMDGAKQTDKFYWNLAWDGLLDTELWDNYNSEISLNPDWILLKEESGYKYDLDKQTMYDINQQIYYENTYTDGKSEGTQAINSNGECN